MEQELKTTLTNDIVYKKKFENGLMCYTIPKKDYLEKEAMVVFNFGSECSDFYINGEEIKMPTGMAHFLEHKMFEQKNYNVFDEFAKAGGNANAFTNFNSTAYYFSCTDNFERNFEILLDYVSCPHFTDESVKKEQGIIGQEIKMYNDDPFWQVYFNMLSNMYKNINIKYSIAGELNSISEINKDLLYKCYQNFYTFDNAAVICTGDLNKEKVYGLIEKNLKLNTNKSAEKKKYEEPESVVNNFVKKSMSVERTLFNIGIKQKANSENVLKNISKIKLLLEIICGDSSEFFEDLYNKSIIDNSFAYDYTCGRDYGFLVLSGFSEYPEKIKDAVFKAVKNIKKSGIDKDAFLSAKRKYIGRFIKSFNSIDAITASQADFFSKGVNLFEYISILENLTVVELEESIGEYFTEENTVVSLIEP